MASLRGFIPNALTSGNLLCGCVALVFIFQWDLMIASFLIFAAALFDFLDGFAARLLRVSGELGKQLDSLADMVSFGVVPGMILFKLIHGSIIINAEHVPMEKEMQLLILPWIGLTVPLFSAYRLAKFNIDTRQSDAFIGLPTPANALFIASFPLIMRWDWQHPPATSDTIFLNPWFLMIVSVVMSILLVSEIRLFALKFKNFSFRDNQVRYLFIGISLAMLIIFQFFAIPFILILYILLSIVSNLIQKT